MSISYFRCDGSVGNSIEPTAKSCSTGWLAVDEPIYSTITVEQGRELFLALAALVVTVAIYRALARIF